MWNINLDFQVLKSSEQKQNFEKMALDYGVIVDSYKAGNGILKTNEYVNHIRKHNQKLSYCGVNTHHKNGVAERAIRTVSECARALMLHLAVHWKDTITSELWSMAVAYAVHLYNHLPNEKEISPADLFTGVTVPRHKVKDYHMWGVQYMCLIPYYKLGKSFYVGSLEPEEECL